MPKRIHFGRTVFISEVYFATLGSGGIDFIECNIDLSSRGGDESGKYYGDGFGG